MIAPRAPGILDYFGPEELILFDLGDADDLAAKIEFVFENPRKIRAIVERGQEVYRAHAWAAERLRFIRLTNELLEGAELSRERVQNRSAPVLGDAGMIGVAVRANERAIAAEFFELLKTPWEFCRREGRYDVVLCTSESLPCAAPQLLLVFSGEATSFDANHGFTSIRDGGGDLSYRMKASACLFMDLWRPSLPAQTRSYARKPRKSRRPLQAEVDRARPCGSAIIFLKKYAPY